MQEKTRKKFIKSAIIFHAKYPQNDTKKPYAICFDIGLLPRKIT